jgi:hypothetical protein
MNYNKRCRPHLHGGDCSGSGLQRPHLFKADICLQGLAVDQLQRGVELTSLDQRHQLTSQGILVTRL